MGTLHFSALCLLLLLDGVFVKEICSKQDVLDYLNLTRGNEKFKTCRPALDWTKPTIVYFDVYLYGILSMIEKSQIFVPLVWISVHWNNDLISWDPKRFCGITEVSLPKEMLWMPDLYVLEAIEKGSEPLNPFLIISYDGNVAMAEDCKIVSTCAMNVHKFPFDTQTCHITVSSVNHSDKELKLLAASNSTKVTQVARESILTEGEWEFLNISISRHHESFEGKTFDGLKYTIAVRRMPMLHFINFQLPILFFLVLDLTSFFLPDGGEKLSFKVTMLLAISVLLLILNDTLPSKSQRCPLIAIFVIVIFSLMFLSVLETILIIYLLNWNSGADKKPHRPQDIYLEIGSSACESLRLEEAQSEEVRNDIDLLKLILKELQNIKRTLVLCSLERKPSKESLSGLVKCINRVFFVLYFIFITVFLVLIFHEWKTE